MSQGAGCWCHAQYGLYAEAEADGLCERCRNRSPSACKNSHEKAGGSWQAGPPPPAVPDIARFASGI